MNRVSRKLTLKDIGELAGVSRSTVSRVINDYPHITPEVRERVQRVIHETGYQPNKIAQSLASSKTGIVGLVIPHEASTIMTNPYFLHLITSITKATNQNNLTLSLFLFHSIDEEERIARSLYSTNLVDGVIVTADRKENPFTEQMVRHNVPFVFIGKPALEMDIPYVNVDNVNGGYTATSHLIERGCKRVAIIMCGHNTAGEDRFAGYRQALIDHGMPFDATLVAEGDFSRESGYAAMQQLIPLQPDGVFVISDLMAVGAQHALRHNGLTSPDDVAIVGFDDLPGAVDADPLLTTIRQPIEQLGAVAVDTLRQIIDEQSIIEQTQVLPVELVIRNT